MQARKNAYGTKNATTGHNLTALLPRHGGRLRRRQQPLAVPAGELPGGGPRRPAPDSTNSTHSQPSQLTVARVPAHARTGIAEPALRVQGTGRCVARHITRFRMAYPADVEGYRSHA